MEQSTTARSAIDRMAREPHPSEELGDQADLLRILNERIDRNRDVISPWEQASLQRSRVLIAGCGSVGGSAVESLARIGIGGLFLADPEPFDISNLNRQACNLSEVGTNKAIALAQRVRAINPLCDVRVFGDGITEQNIDSALEGVSLVFDGIDVGAAPMEKYSLHARACAHGIPVMAGMDFGGKAVLYVFDYRRPRTKPFYGKTTESAHRERRFADCLKWLGNAHFPADFLPVISDRLVTKRPWPQIAYCVQAMGAIATRCAVEILAGRRVRHVVAFDSHMVTRSASARALARVLVLPRLVRALRISKSSGDQQLVAQEGARTYSLADEIIAAIRSAPSPHNCQPWEIERLGEGRIRVALSADRLLPVVDSSNRGAITSLGCAIEAAAWVADIRVTTGSMDAARCELVIEALGLREDAVWQGRALLATRVTNRFRYTKVPLPQPLINTWLQAVEDMSARLHFETDIHAQLRDTARAGALRLFRRDDYVAELLEHIRFSRAEEGATGSGMTPRGLGLPLLSAAFLRVLRSSAHLRRGSLTLGLARLMATNAVRHIPHSGTFALISIPEEDAGARIDAGRVMMRVWLHLTHAGYACQPIDFTICDDEVRDRTARLFKLDPDRIPAVVLRIGRPLVQVGRSTSRKAAEVLAPAAVGSGRGLG